MKLLACFLNTKHGPPCILMLNWSGAFCTEGSLHLGRLYQFRRAVLLRGEEEKCCQDRRVWKVLVAKCARTFPGMSLSFQLALIPTHCISLSAVYKMTLWEVSGF